MSGVQRCEWEYTRVTALADNVALAARWFGLSESDVEAAAGRFVRGKNKGKVRGWIAWRKCKVGGWVTGAGVIRPGMIFAHFCRTWNDAAGMANKTGAEFLACARRVDAQYGHDPLNVPTVQVPTHIQDIADEIEEHKSAGRSAGYTWKNVLESAPTSAGPDVSRMVAQAYGLTEAAVIHDYLALCRDGVFGDQLQAFAEAQPAAER